MGPDTLACFVLYYSSLAPLERRALVQACRRPLVELVRTCACMLGVSCHEHSTVNAFGYNGELLGIASAAGIFGLLLLLLHGLLDNVRLVSPADGH